MASGSNGGSNNISRTSRASRRRTTVSQFDPNGAPF